MIPQSLKNTLPEPLTQQGLKDLQKLLEEEEAEHKKEQDPIKGKPSP